MLFFQPFFVGNPTESDGKDSGILLRESPGSALVFYYPSEEYLSYLMMVNELEYYDEIPCGDLFEGKNARERIVIFSLPCRKL